MSTREDTFRQRITPVLIAAAFFLFFSAGAAQAAIKPGVKVADGNLTLAAKSATVGEILEQIARVAGVDIFIARGFQPTGQRITVEFNDEPLEEALRRILQGYNYAAIYEKEGNDFRVAALNIYPEGQASGEVLPLFSGGRTPLYEEKNRRGETVTVLVNAGGDIVTRGNLTTRRGVLGPSQTEVTGNGPLSAGLQTPWFALQLQQEQEEVERFADLLMLRRQAELATDTAQKQTLALAYADAVAKFETFKRANTSKIESLKRLNQFQEVTQQ